MQLTDRVKERIKESFLDETRIRLSGDLKDLLRDNDRREAWVKDRHSDRARVHTAIRAIRRLKDKLPR